MNKKIVTIERSGLGSSSPREYLSAFNNSLLRTTTPKFCELIVDRCQIVKLPRMYESTGCLVSYWDFGDFFVDIEKVWKFDFIYRTRAMATRSRFITAPPQKTC